MESTQISVSVKTSPSSRIGSLKELVHKLLLSNRRHFGEYQYTVPSPISYPYQWFWDSAFHSIMLSNFNIEDAKKEIYSVVAKQFENGMIPHMIYWHRIDHVVDVKWGRADTSTITQPPIISYAVWQIYQKDKDKMFLKKIYPHLWHFIMYLLTERDPHGHHLVGILNPDESGEDDSPRFDIPLGLPPVQTLEENFKYRLKLIEKNKECGFDAPFCMRDFFWVKDVPFNVIMVKSLYCMSDIACEIGEFEHADYFCEQAKLMIKAMRKYMFEDGIFWSTYGQDYKKIKTLTWAIFAPLFARIYTHKEARDLVHKHLLNEEEFNLPYMVPTVAKSDPSFNPQGFWRGPVWFSTNWMIYKGLLQYGYEKEATRIRESCIELLEKNGLREQFNPLTGAGGGAEQFTWGGLVLDMVK